MMMNNNDILLTNTEPRKGTREKVTPVSRKQPLRFLGIEKWSEMEPATGLKNQITNELVN